MSAAMKCVLFFALASAVCAQVGVTDHEDAIVPEATQDVAPMEFVDEEALQRANDEAHQEASSYLQKAGAGACAKLADATEQEVKDNVKAQQDILNKIDKGAACPQRGQAAVTTMKEKLKAAENASKDAAKKYTDALNVDVDFGKRKFSSLTEGNCATFFNSAAYTSAKKKVADAKKKKEEAAGKVTQAKKDLKAAEDAAKLSVRNCQCDTYKAHEKALADANAKVKSANTKAWTKAAHLKCVLAGKTTNQCTVPALPKVVATSLATGVTSGACSAWEGRSQCTAADKQDQNSGNSLLVFRSSGNNNWHAGCYMKQQIPANRQHDYMLEVEWKKNNAGQGYAMWGFNHLKKGEQEHYYPAIDYAFYCYNNHIMYVYESGSGKGYKSNCPCQTHAQTRMIMTKAGKVTYELYHGGWKTCYTSSNTASNSVPYVIDNSMYQQGATIKETLYEKINNGWKVVTA